MGVCPFLKRGKRSPKRGQVLKWTLPGGWFARRFSGEGRENDFQNEQGEMRLSGGRYSRRFSRAGKENDFQSEEGEMDFTHGYSPDEWHLTPDTYTRETRNQKTKCKCSCSFFVSSRCCGESLLSYFCCDYLRKERERGEDFYPFRVFWSEGKFCFWRGVLVPQKNHFLIFEGGEFRPLIGFLTLVADQGRYPFYFPFLQRGRGGGLRVLRFRNGIRKPKFTLCTHFRWQSDVVFG